MTITIQPLVLSNNAIKTDVMTAELWRGAVLESRHSVHATLVDETGAVLASAGDPALTTTARSSLKPFQLWAGLSQGVSDETSFSDEELALMCASHNGEPEHVKGCEALLHKLGATVSDLECGAHAPYHSSSAEAILRAGGSYTALHNNCSGKHCGLLALRSYLKAQGSYLDPNHPTQQVIFDSVRELLHINRALAIGVDGCSLPTPELQLKEMALLFARLASGRASEGSSQDPHLERIFKAMSAHPRLVAGTGRFDTALMSVAPGQVVSKVGGEAIRGVAIRTPDGGRYGVALKVSDGAMRALHPACLAFLERCGFLTRAQLTGDLARFVNYPETNWSGLEVTRIHIRG